MNARSPRPAKEHVVSLTSASVISHLQKLRKERSKPQSKPGWFADPRKIEPYRYWNGTTWTEETSATLP